MKAYDDVRTTNPENAFSLEIVSAFKAKKAYDDIQGSIIGIRNSAWAKRRDDIFIAKFLHLICEALLRNDLDLIGIIVKYNITDK